MSVATGLAAGINFSLNQLNKYSPSADKTLAVDWACKKEPEQLQSQDPPSGITPPPSLDLPEACSSAVRLSWMFNFCDFDLLTHHLLFLSETVWRWELDLNF